MHCLFPTSVLELLYERAMSWIMDALDIWLGFTQPYARLEVAQAGFEADRVMDYCPCCGSSVGRGEVHVWKDRLCCTECRYRVHAVSRVIRLGPYCSPLRPWILQIKFHRWEPLAKELGCCLAQQVRDRYRQQARGHGCGTDSYVAMASSGARY